MYNLFTTKQVAIMVYKYKNILLFLLHFNVVHSRHEASLVKKIIVVLVH